MYWFREKRALHFIWPPFRQGKTDLGYISGSFLGIPICIISPRAQMANPCPKANQVSELFLEFALKPMESVLNSLMFHIPKALSLHSYTILFLPVHSHRFIAFASLKRTTLFLTLSSSNLCILQKLTGIPQHFQSSLK